MQSIRRTFTGALVLAAVLAVAGSLTACGEKDAPKDSGTDEAAVKKVPNTSRPTLFTVRRGGNLIAAVFTDGQTPPGGALIYSLASGPPTPMDNWMEAGGAPPTCAEYHPQIPDAQEATWQAPTMPPEMMEDWRMYVGSNMMGSHPCPPPPPEGE